MKTAEPVENPRTSGLIAASWPAAGAVIWSDFVIVRRVSRRALAGIRRRTRSCRRFTAGRIHSPEISRGLLEGRLGTRFRKTHNDSNLECLQEVKNCDGTLNTAGSVGWRRLGRNGAWAGE
jgi:hypothetical protein